MFSKYIESQSSDAIELINKGYKIINVENLELLSNILAQFKDYLKEQNNIVVKDLSELHNHLDIKNLNSIRHGFYEKLNKESSFSKTYLELAFKTINDVVGSELAANRSVNFSIQIPNDTTSKLGIHSDCFSGESEFQINLWVPLTDARDTNSMFIFNPDFSRDVINNISKFEKLGIENLLNEHEDQYEFVNLSFGEALVFTPTCLHGNVINTTQKTRISFNCRYKNLFSPYCKNEENEKKLGTFYIPITPKAATIIGLKNKIKY